MIPFTYLKYFRLGDIFADMISVLVNIYVLYVHRPFRLALSSKIQADLILRKKIFERTYGIWSICTECVCAVPHEFQRSQTAQRGLKDSLALSNEDAAPCRL